MGFIRSTSFHSNTIQTIVETKKTHPRIVRMAAPALSAVVTGSNSTFSSPELGFGLLSDTAPFFWLRGAIPGSMSVDPTADNALNCRC